MLKRFIAAAVCPACGQADKLVVYVGPQPQQRECVACGYSDTLDDNGNIRELTTRVNAPPAAGEALPHEADVQVLKLGD